MALIKFIFILAIVLPVALVMFYLFRKLTGEYNELIKNERARKKTKPQPSYPGYNSSYYRPEKSGGISETEKNKEQKDVSARKAKRVKRKQRKAKKKQTE